METEANQLRMPDLAPEAVTQDDGGQQQQAYTPPAAEPQGESEQKAEPQQWKDEKRGEIFSRAREKRLAETEPFSGDPNDPDALYGSTTDQSDLGELEREALRRRQEHMGEIAQPPEGQPQGQPHKPLNGLAPELLSQRVPVIVDGQQYEVTVEDALREFQINRAADKRLEQAKAILQQTQQFQRHQQPQPSFDDAGYNEPSAQDDAAGNTDDYGDDRGDTSRSRTTNVKELVEKIQLGTPDEAAAALEEFVSSAVNRPAPVDETTRVLTALEDHNAKQAVLAFAEQNPHLASNDTLRSEATKQIYKNMAIDLVRAGYSMEQLHELAPGPQELTQLHKQARISRLRGVRPVSELISAGYQGALEELRSLVTQAAPSAAPHQAQTMAQRQQRKESLQPQPAARRLSPGMTAPSQTRTQDHSRAAAVAKMRQARGQPV